MPVPGTVMANEPVGRTPCRSTGSNHPSSDVTRSAVDVPPSCPPARQTTRTGVPCAAMPAAFSSAWARVNNESSSPWLSNVGAVMRPRTPAGLEARRRVTRPGPGSPVWAACWYAAQRSGANLPHAPGCAPGVGDDADAKSSEAHIFLNTPPSVASPLCGTTPFGKSDWVRSFQVMSAPIASTRGSYAPSRSASAPP
ncbi:hypothetical protein GALL_335120 [mine drainage metagenome]|uniref:Uncharacterized protein n=1 Tax=mine drainage metagenome TaxID=410659 RepID=A0A1J5QY57_9ZZZZ